MQFLTYEYYIYELFVNLYYCLNIFWGMQSWQRRKVTQL